MDCAYNIGTGVEDVDTVIPSVEERIDELQEEMMESEVWLKPRMMELVACYEHLWWLAENQRSEWDDVLEEKMGRESDDPVSLRSWRGISLVAKAVYIVARVEFQSEKYATEKIERLKAAKQLIKDEYDWGDVGDDLLPIISEHATTP